MANLSFTQWAGDGIQKSFAISFEYLDKSHITVTVNNVVTPFTWDDPHTIHLADAPAAGVVIEARRKTPRESRMVDFVDGSVLSETDLDLSALQVFFIVQEAIDIAGGTLELLSDGSYGAGTRRISSLGDPLYPQDAVTKAWAETAMSSQLTQAATKATEAAASALAAAASAANALSHASTASNKATEAFNSAGAAASSAGSAAASASTATTKATEAGVKAVEAASSAANALASENNAKDAADRAALFDPTSYYTKIVSDERYAPQTHSHDDRYYTESEVDTKLSLKAPLASPSFTGTVTGITKGMIGLGNVDNTTDVAKPISSATQTALNTKAPSISPTFTGGVTTSGGSDSSLLMYRHSSFAHPSYSWRITSDNNLILHRNNNSTGAFVKDVFGYIPIYDAFYATSAIIGTGVRSSFGGYGNPPLQAESIGGSHIGLGLRTDGSNGLAFCAFYKGGTGVTGSISDNGAGGVAYNTTSDYRLKKIIGPLGGALGVVKSANVYSGTWYADPSADPEPMMLAHEISEFAPRAVAGEKDATADVPVYDNDNDYLGDYPIPLHQVVDYSKLVPLLFAATKELSEAVEQQAAEIEILKNLLQPPQSPLE